jgi:flagellar basal body-associated protein FliL
MDEAPEIAMDNLPPKTLKTQLVRLDHNLKQIERSQFAGIQRAPGSLPVLEAFQEFLDNERKKAKRRLIAISLFFTLILLLAGGAGVAVVTIQMNRMSVGYDTVAAQADSLKSSLESTRELTHTSLTTLESRIDADSIRLSERHDELLTAHKGVETQIGTEIARVTEMETLLERLATENTALKTDLDRVMKDWPAMTRQVQEISSLQMGKQPPRKPVLAAAELLTPVKRSNGTPPVDPDTLALTIVPPGETAGIRWRLPLIRE